VSELWSEGLASLEPYVPGEQPRQIIADYHRVEPNQVFVGNGSDEVLAHAFRAFFCKAKPLLFPDITYSFYPVYCKLFGIDYQQIPLREDFSLHLADYSADNAGVIFANPNAPTAMLLDKGAIENFLYQSQQSVVLVDEAYIDFAGSDCGVTASAIDLVSRFSNLLVTRTLSKSRALAGLRLGYAIGSPTLIEGLVRVKDSFNSYPIDHLSSVLAMASFSDQAYFESIVQQVVEQRTQLTKILNDLGFTVLPSEANFVFVKHHQQSADKLAAGLRERGIIVRHFNKPRLKDYLRITVGDKTQNQLLVGALQSLLAAA